MPLELWSKNLFQDRIDFHGSLTSEEIQVLIADRDLKVIQCAKPVDWPTWERLNHEFFTRRPEVQLRVYGFYTPDCNLAFTTLMTNVHHFSADCLLDAVGVDHIASMQNLESLGVGIYHLEGFEFLEQITPRLKMLFLGRTKSKKPDLAPLSRLESLEELMIEGQQKHIEVVSTLKNLQRIVLRSISTPDLSYLQPLQQMWSLDIKLGGIRDLNAIEGMENIKYFELWWIRGLSDIHVISSLTGLQSLFLQSLPNIIALPSFNRLEKLRRIILANLKGLRDMRSLEFAPALEEFAHWEARAMQPEDYLPLFRNPRLKGAAASFWSIKKDKRFKELLKEHGIDPAYEWQPFEFI